ncbi:diacylglycerol/lipid kinase family protein [Agrococcus casei]|uniref:diacylglycerol/lipid kinase family protein n=1 Tax=Agrococcus casei TaxID=343512 RepID=UPI003F92AA66
MRAAIVFNPVKVSEEDLRKAVDHTLGSKADEASVDYRETGEKDFGVTAFEESIKAEPDVIIVAGGDGTVRLGADMVSKTEIPLGIVPAGTGNLLARNLSLPLALRDAVRVALTGDNRSIDMGELILTREDGTEEREAFTVLAGFGLDAGMIAMTDDDMKKKVGWVAYVGGFFRAFSSIKRIEIRGQVDEADERELTANTVLIGNAGMLPGNVRVFPDAKIDDGLLDYALVDPKDSLEWVLVVHEMVSNNDPLQRELRDRSILPGRKRIPQLAFKQGKQFTLKLDEAIELQIDGDSVGEITGLRASVLPSALTVRVPR